ncbi:acetyl/propionyl-CoA carboxylase, alpha subunit [Chthonomonas calidirosea]|uniref:acetyl-CoA carboxylase biotin carboxyl carrier protein subunit n=1 Tax=Chthonomonas calidirosea TaxID=454171 RepID=UPI0006DD5622|nr:acetyl-CoA carboxylase biotin carboxyl carrier protein subunit [Chthonomonas calidirosea]CEK19837.1 acetyl/propionyl-CoA carboxylase, alpha subunit [Chthonomonas calidirosea]
MRYQYRLEADSESPIGFEIEGEGETYKVTLPNGRTHRVRVRSARRAPWVEIALCDAEGQPERLLRVPIVELRADTETSRKSYDFLGQGALPLNGRLAISWQGQVYLFTRVEEGSGELQTHEDAGLIRAPMVGVVSEVLVSEGQFVEKEQPLLVLEAMKVVMRMAAPYAGQVKRLWVHAGQLVSHGETLVELTKE